MCRLTAVSGHYSKQIIEIEMIKCTYCGNNAELVTGERIYPHRPDLYALSFWLCAPCDAYVGCHKKGANVPAIGESDGTLPLGSLANAELRMWRQAAHSVLDPIWKSKQMGRRDVYRKLAKHLGIRYRLCHISLFGIDRCQKAIEFLKKEFPSS
jgi:hypothetical protein